MQFNIDEIVSKWEIEETKFKKLGKALSLILKNSIYELEIHPEITYRVKDILSIVRKIKKKNQYKDYDYNSMPDKLGIRIICLFSEDMDLIDKYIQGNFIVKKDEKKKDALDHNKLDYISNHYDLSIDVSKKDFKRLAKYKDLIFELQVKTLNQHTWSNTSHALSYKQEANLSDGLKRKVFRLLSLYEIADDEFSFVNTTMCASPDNIVYSLLRKTEGKIYKFAKVDFDREMSLTTLNTLLSYFKPEQRVKISREIEDFIKENENKIRNIFLENIKRLYKIPYIAQPEIFIIWYALVKLRFAITNNWNNDFNPDELEQIEILWGKDIE